MHRHAERSAHLKCFTVLTLSLWCFAPQAHAQDPPQGDWRPCGDACYCEPIVLRFWTDPNEPCFFRMYIDELIGPGHTVSGNIAWGDYSWDYTVTCERTGEGTGPCVRSWPTGCRGFCDKCTYVFTLEATAHGPGCEGQHRQCIGMYAHVEGPTNCGDPECDASQCKILYPDGTDVRGEYKAYLCPFFTVVRIYVESSTCWSSDQADCDDDDPCTDDCCVDEVCRHDRPARGCGVFIGPEIITACPGLTVPICAQICNTSECLETYYWSAETPPPSMGGGGPMGSPSLPMISPDSGSVTLAGQHCADVCFDVYLPPDSQPGAPTKIDFTVTSYGGGVCGPVDTDGCSDTVTVTAGALEVIPHRTNEPADTIYMLPGDVETFTLNPGGTSGMDVVYVIADPALAQFKVGSLLSTSITSSGPPDVLRIKTHETTGITQLELHLASADGPMLCSRPIKVGGTVTLEVDGFLTYDPYDPLDPSQPEPPGPPGDPVITVDPPAPVPDFQLGDADLPPSTTQALESANLDNAIMHWRVEVWDYDGNPMRGKDLLVLWVPDEPTDLNVNRITVEQPVALTDDRGRVEGQAYLAKRNLDAANETWRLLILIGDTALLHQQNPLTPEELNERAEDNQVPLEERIFNGHLIRLQRDLTGAPAGEARPITAYTFPHVSRSFHLIMGDFFDGILERQTISLDSTAPGWPIPEEDYWRLWELKTTAEPIVIESDLWVAPALREISIPSYSTLNETALLSWPAENIVTELMEALGHAVQPEVPDPSDPPVGQTPSDLTALKVSAIVAEVAIGFAPMGDSYDIIVETWHFFSGDDVSELVLSLAFAGLAADIGTYIPVTTAVGAPINAVIAVAKAVVKVIPQPVVKAIVAAGGGGRAGVRVMLNYFSQFFRGYQAGDLLQLNTFREIVGRLLTQLYRMIDSPLGLDADSVGKATRVLAGRGRVLSDDAAEGLAFLAKRGKVGLSEQLFREFGDDIVEKALENARRLAVRGATDLSDEALRGLAVAQRAVGSSSTAVREFVEGTVVTAERAEKALSNVNRIDGVDGLDEMVHFLKHNADNADGIDGAVFEGTVARRILDGQVPGSGALRRVSADGLEGANRIDTTTDTLAIQIKHKRADAHFVPSDIRGSDGVSGRDYLVQLRAQAIVLNRQPALMTNRSISQDLQGILDDLAIVWTHVPD